MANAVALTEQVEVHIEPVYETMITGYRIDLTVREAIVLRAILSNVGGMPTGHRGDANDIMDALSGLGIDSDAVEAVSGCIVGNTLNAPPGTTDWNGSHRGAIYFGPSKVIND